MIRRDEGIYILPQRVSLHLTAIGACSLLYGAPSLNAIGGTLFGVGVVHLIALHMFRESTDAR